MRYLVFGDVHGNYEAMKTVLAEGQQRGVGAYLFVGDLLGYGPNPLECIQVLMGLKQSGLAWVAGNHELAVRGDVAFDGYSVEARRTLQWTRMQLDGEEWAMKFLLSAPLTAEVNREVWLTHESLAHPGSAQYNREPLHAVPELKALAKHGGRVAFYGHTHKVRAELMNHAEQVTPAEVETFEGEGLDPKPVKVADGQRLWMGVGSVGFPVNKGRKTEFLILDDEHWHIEKYAVAYPRERTKARVEKILGPVCGQDVAAQIARWL